MANVTAVFVGAGMIDVPTASLMGGVSIAFGILTFSGPVVNTVGKTLVSIITLKRILLAWFFTPFVACTIALVISYISRLRYIP